MASISIPHEQLHTLGSLVDLTERQMQTLLDVLSEVPLSVDLETLEKQAASKLTSVSKHPEKLVRSIIALNVTRAHAEPPVPEFVQRVLEALEEAEVTGKKREIAEDRLTKLLTLPELNVATKAIHLKLDHERLLAQPRILTDARPIYGPDVSEAPLAVLITHTLKLSYYQDEKQVDFYVVLDDDDISALEEVLQRAKLKARSLRNIFQAANLKVVLS